MTRQCQQQDGKRHKCNATLRQCQKCGTIGCDGQSIFVCPNKLTSGARCKNCGAASSNFRRLE
ncbi:MAG: hypothetical protein IT378_10020 [Sandaracinaceae bacterium]|nr:hypothetical protein [Sandaracinaceae bacterium]